MSLVPSKYSDRPRGDNVNVSHQSSLVTDQITHEYIQLVVTGSIAYTKYHTIGSPF